MPNRHTYIISVSVCLYVRRLSLISMSVSLSVCV